jgi:hypothetical protein
VNCDSCGGRIGGPRLFCLDCAIKSTETYNSVDLCSAPQCVGAHVTRKDLELAHEPGHRLVKVRTSVQSRTYGHTHTAACNAFERVEELRRKMAESKSHPDEEIGPDEQNTSSFGPTPTEMPAKNDKPEDVLNPLDSTKGGAEVEVKTARRDQVQDESLPACGKCKGHLSFPFWYCIFCEGWSQG